MWRSDPEGSWQVELWEGNYENDDFSFGFMDVSKFTKREGLDIYDYPLEQEMIDRMVQDMEFGNAMVVGEVQCYLNWP